mgnify:CR=1 FL=1|tara:strand:- start:335 stop:1408 length:1074 start_codon:yes stop_codon:yes gene_type:complete
MLHAVIMSGGSGTRFWPRSRRDRPKQLQKLIGDTSLLAQSYERLEGLVPAERTWIVTNRVQHSRTASQLPAVPATQVLAEPIGRNTAPCIGLAAIHLLDQDPDAVMIVMPSDHLISPREDFQQTISRAAELVAEDSQRLVLLGVPPTRPATGYGYIQRGEPLGGDSAGFAVNAFHEKPDRATAESYIAESNVAWNCGIFVWRADRILDVLAIHQPEIATGLATIRTELGGDGLDQVAEDVFGGMPAISIDHGVLEHAEGVCLVEAPFAWSDVGSWHALAETLGSDVHDNTLQGSVVADRASGCVILSDDEHLVAATGVKDLVIVHTPDATLVARRDDEEGLKRLVQLIEEHGHGGHL